MHMIMYFIISICLLDVYFQKVAQVASAICICDDSTHNKLLYAIEVYMTQLRIVTVEQQRQS